MVSGRVQRRIDLLLDEADAAIAASDWDVVEDRARNVLALDPDNADAKTFIAAAQRARRTDTPHGAPVASDPESNPLPSSFADGRYAVRSLLGEGGKKRVYLAHDERLDRDVAFALIKTEGLDKAGRQRVTREAQAMGKLGDHPCLMPIHDTGEEDGSPYLVLPLMPGGDVESLLQSEPEHRLGLERAVEIAKQVARGLEFAHRKGIVHRDLKPGNVWLTADGDVKIGDFGLAVATNRSRLTEEGMMVGTAAYMAPEQAMGQEVTPQADLYSLGAMLYEMVTGRPPFVGDDNVAIITQHLNTPPVVPTWHRPDCPPGLEALLLRLLEKDASKRPATASEVLQALVAVDVSARPEPVEGQPQQPPTNPIYRRTFVGREGEVRQLQDAFDGAVSGQGALAMVVGEPGIGKTSICEQLATYVAMRGGKTLVGHSYEEGSLSLPYLPFVEALRTYVLDRDPDALRDELGSHASDVARIVSEVRERVRVQPREAGDPEDDRWRLLQSVSGFLKNASNVQPLVIVLEDLHWTDRGTLDLLLHVARNLEGARVLIVGTYRDVEVDRQHPLSAALAELRRGIPFGRVVLRGLTPDEVHRMLNALTSQEMRWGLAEAIHRQTEGNPLFIQEVMRYLVEEGYISHDTGEWHRAGEEAPEAFIPEGLRDVIGKRLTRLSDECNRVLSIAAVIGRDFDLAVLQKVAELPEDDVLTALEEADRAGVIEERGRAGAAVTFRFSHAFFRQTLYEEIFGPRRIRMHQEVGRALQEVHARNLKDHASELAEHFGQSTEESDLSKAVLYGTLGAERAMSVYAYSEAVRLIEQAIKAQEVLDPLDAESRCGLLLALCEAYQAGSERSKIMGPVTEAAELAQRIHDDEQVVRACQIAMDTSITQGGGTEVIDVAEAMSWVDLADRHASRDSKQRVRVDLSRGWVSRNVGFAAEGWALWKGAYLLAERLRDAEGQALAWGFLYGPETTIEDFDWVVRSVDSIAIAGERDPVRSARELLTTVVFALLSLGRRSEAQNASERALVIARERNDAASLLTSQAGGVLFLAADGDLEGAVALAEEQREFANQHDLEALGRGHYGRSARRALVYLGRLDEALATVPDPPDLFTIGGAMAGQRSYLLALNGRNGEAQPFLDAFMEHLHRGGHLSATVHRYLLEAAIHLGDEAACAQLIDAMDALKDFVVFEAWMGFCIARQLGDASVVLSRHDQARSYFEKGIEVSERLPFKPELALSHLGLAEVLLDHYSDERAAAIEHLDFAINEFRDMKMQPSLDRALRRKDLLGA